MFHSLRGAVRHVDFIESLDDGLESIMGDLGGFTAAPGGADLVYIILRRYDPCENHEVKSSLCGSVYPNNTYTSNEQEIVDGPCKMGDDRWLPHVKFSAKGGLGVG